MFALVFSRILFTLTIVEGVNLFLNGPFWVIRFIEYTKPGFVYHLQKNAWDLVYPADFWNTREMREI